MTRPLQTSSEFCKSRLLTLLTKIIKLLFSVCCIQPGVAQPHYDRSQIDARSVLYPSSADVHIHTLFSERKIESQECNVRGLAYHLARHWYNHVLQMVSNPMFTTPPH